MEAALEAQDVRGRGAGTAVSHGEAPEGSKHFKCVRAVGWRNSCDTSDVTGSGLRSGAELNAIVVEEGKWLQDVNSKQYVPFHDPRDGKALFVEVMAKSLAHSAFEQLSGYDHFQWSDDRSECRCVSQTGARCPASQEA